jgi:hypothetical protein
MLQFDLHKVFPDWHNLALNFETSLYFMVKSLVSKMDNTVIVFYALYPAYSAVTVYVP